ncbi:MAG: DUF308 domain-containing protein [Muribaculaceae bacterium]|nr:DUF308 domain-containing protein [Muribaculaceae bacterium]
MKNKNFIYTYLFTLIGGVLLIILNNRAGIFEAMSIVLGIGFLIIGILSMLSALFISDAAKEAGAKRSPILIIVSGASFLLGLLMVIAPTFFINYLIYSIALLMIIVGIIQLCNFLPQMSSIGMSYYFLIVPCLSMLAGIIVFCVKAEAIKDSLALLTGFVLTVYSINGFIGYFSRRSLSAGMGGSSEIINIK